MQIANKAKQINSLLPVGKQVFIHLQDSRTPSCVIVTWEDKHHPSKYPPFFLFPLLYILSIVFCGLEFAFSQFESPVPAVSAPNLPHTCHSTAGM